MHKKYIKRTFFIIIIFLFVISLVNIFVDPGKIYLKKVVAKQEVNNYIEKIISSKLGIFRSGWNERLVKTTFAEKAGDYECVILGSSHIMQISHIRNIGNIQTQCKNLLNLGVSGAGLEDIFVLSDIILNNHKLPKKIFIDIDPWTLKFNTDSRYGAYINEYADINKLLEIDNNINTVSYLNKVIVNLINWEYFYSSVQILKKKKEKTFDYFNQKIGHAPTKPYRYSEGSYGSIILPDGAHIYSRAYSLGQKKKNSKIPIGGGGYKIKGNIVNKKAVISLEKLLQFYKDKNIEVALILTPYHPNVFKSGETKTVKHMKKVKSIVLDIAKKHNLKVYGSFFPEELKCKENEFLDFMHPTTDCLNKIDFTL